MTFWCSLSGSDGPANGSVVMNRMGPSLYAGTHYSGPDSCMLSRMEMATRRLPRSSLTVDPVNVCRSRRTTASVSAKTLLCLQPLRSNVRSARTGGNAFALLTNPVSSTIDFAADGTGYTPAADYSGPDGRACRR